jgi:C4-dicarboxylate-specific signal transduction histidine kinase
MLILTQVEADSLQQLFLDSGVQIAVVDPHGNPLFTSSPDTSVKHNLNPLWLSIKQMADAGLEYPGRGRMGKAADAIHARNRAYLLIRFQVPQ